MKLNQYDLDNGVLKISLEGSLDLNASSEIDGRFGTIAASQKKLVVDLTGVDFMASIGIRVLVKTAKAIANHGGRMAAYGAQESVERVLNSTGVGTLVNLKTDEAEALQEVNR